MTKTVQIATITTGVLVLELINEFMQFHELGYSQSVFLSESNLQHPPSRTQLFAKVGLKQNEEPDQQKARREPILVALLKKSRGQPERSSGSRNARKQGKTRLVNARSAVRGCQRRGARRRAGSRRGEGNRIFKTGSVG